MDRIKHLAQESVAVARETAEKLSRLKGFSLHSVQGLIQCVLWTVKHVEEIGLREALTGPDKQALAVEILLSVVKLPWWLPEAWVRAVLPELINVVVAALNDRFGKAK